MTWRVESSLRHAVTHAQVSAIAWLLKGCVGVDRVVPLLASSSGSSSFPRWNVAKVNSEARPYQTSLENWVRGVSSFVSPLARLSSRKEVTCRHWIASCLFSSGLVLTVCCLVQYTGKLGFDKGDRWGMFDNLFKTLFVVIYFQGSHNGSLLPFLVCNKCERCTSFHAVWPSCKLAWPLSSSLSQDC